MVLLCSVALAGIVGAAWLALRYFDFPSAAGQLPEAERRARAMRLPLVAADIQPNPPVTPSENAASDLRILCSLVRDTVKRNDTAAEDDLDSGRTNAAAEKLRRFQGVLEAARRAARKPRVDLGREWDRGAFVRFPEYGWYRSAARLLGVDAVLRARHGETEGTLEDLRAMHGLARLAGQEPTMLGCMVDCAIDRLRNRSVERILEVWQADDPRLGALGRELAHQADTPRISWALMGEEFEGVATIRNLKVPVDAPASRLRKSGVPEGVEARAILARHFQAWETIWPAITERPENPIAIQQAIRAYTGKLRRESGFSYTLLPSTIGSFEKSSIAPLRLAAETSALQELIDLMRYRRRTGRWPTSLIVAGLNRRDPFTGQGLRYRVADDTVRVYSVADDGQDNRGITRQELPIGKKDSPNDEAAIFPISKTKTVRDRPMDGSGDRRS